MFRQTILLVSLIALATAQSAYYAHGVRQDGDQFIETIYQQTELTEETSTHIVNVRISDANTTLTYVQYNVLEGFDTTYSYGIGQIKITKFHANQLTVTTSVYGFPLQHGTEEPSY